MKKLLNKKGFTLIELIVVIAILAILAMILIPSLTGYIAKATAAKDAANCRSTYTKYQLDLAVAVTPSTVPAPTLDGATVAETHTDSTVNTFSCAFTGGGTYSLSGNFVASP